MERAWGYFSRTEMRRMIVPLFLEQLLVMLVGMADTLVISYAGEAAVSGVSLVNQFNTIFVFLFTALTSGGAVVISQYIGRKAYEQASESASSLLKFSVLFSIVLSLMVLIGNEAMLRLLFGNVDADVMRACVTYLRISALSYPALAVYNAGTAVYRSIGKTRVTMVISLISNAINLAGNIIGVFVMKAGVAGVAWPSFIARVFSAVAVLVLCFRKTGQVRFSVRYIVRRNGELLRTILGIAIPNGVESGIFQLIKVAIFSIVAMFGTYQIAANGVAQSIWSLSSLFDVTMGAVFITAIGRCMGNGDTEAADAFFRTLLRLTLILMTVWNLLILALTPLFMMAYSLSPETKSLTFRLVFIHNILKTVVYPYSGVLPSGLRAAGDVRFTMLVTLFSTIAGRLLLSYVLGIGLNMGVTGVVIAMVLDWCIRAVIFRERYRRGKWKRFKVLKN